MVAVFSALSLGTNYALIDLPNVKLMDSFVFLASYLFGLRVGLGVAVSTWLVYGFVNPYGQDDLILLSFLITGECFYAISASMLRRAAVPRSLLDDKTGYARFSLLVGVAGLLATLAYDVLTNFASWLFRTNTLYNNLVLFATVVPSAVIAAKRYNGNILAPRGIS